ncbi:unnamed protein product [Cuscuta campestris]|uniref:Cyclic nucleotide-binding domain-containing protein n=1 Tax=Cuscuta campestris TaxID=132261 RepID=A0A484LEI7_9ASTE|nr:unnamed protein product [Cuscuta campestris]
MIFLCLRGDYVLREGEAGDGIHFIWDGVAEVSGHVEEDNPTKYQLKKYDYFGHGLTSSSQHAGVVALTKLTCLLLRHEHCNLLQPISIWNADKAVEKCSLVEHIMHLEPLEVDIFQGITLPDAPKFGKVFGGQFVGQALAAATKTVNCLKIVHSIHAHFHLGGDVDIPIMYQVHRVRDGKSFATRRVDAIQKQKVVFTLVASFQKDEEGFDHQDALMPIVPDPETLLSLEELRERRLTDPRLPGPYRNTLATAEFVPWPIEIRFCDPNVTSQTKSPPSLRFWFRAKGNLSDDQALHRCVVAFASDLIFGEVGNNPHRKRRLNIATISLDHAMWFHRPLRADDWILFVIGSPSACNARSFVSGQMYDRTGTLVVSLTQEALQRVVPPAQKPIGQSNL